MVACSASDLAKLGVLDFEGLKRARLSQGGYLVEGLFRDRSVNLLVGDSGLGKTPLAIALAVAVASGRTFMDHVVRAGPVLYCDAESGLDEVIRLLDTASRSAGLSKPPDELRVWSPNFEHGPPKVKQPVMARLFANVRASRPQLVVIDPLRAFWSWVEEKTSEATGMLRGMRETSRQIGCSWLLIHHRRKRNPNNQVSLEQDRHIWFEEAAGSLAIVNGSDTRLGIEMSRGPGDLILAGFVRSVGWVGPLHLERLSDEDGDPLGYRLMTGVDFLSAVYRSAFMGLPERFRFKDAKQALGGKSDSAAKAFLDQCLAARLARKDGKEYVKNPRPDAGAPGATP